MWLGVVCVVVVCVCEGCFSPVWLCYPNTPVIVLGAAAPKRRVLGDERAIGGSVDGLDLLLGNPDKPIIEQNKISLSYPLGGSSQVYPLSPTVLSPVPPPLEQERHIAP